MLPATREKCGLELPQRLIKLPQFSGVLDQRGRPRPESANARSTKRRVFVVSKSRISKTREIPQPVSNRLHLPRDL